MTTFFPKKTKYFDPVNQQRTCIVDGECAVDIVCVNDILGRVVLYLALIAPPENLLHGAMIRTCQRTCTTHRQQRTVTRRVHA